MYNRKSFEKNLKKRFREKLEESQRGENDLNEKLLTIDPKEVDDKLVQETLSYEMLIKLAIYHHKKAKEATESLKEIAELRLQVQNVMIQHSNTTVAPEFQEPEDIDEFKSLKNDNRSSSPLWKQ